jgi:hypothetical protein
MTGLIGWIALGQVFPGYASAQDPQNTVRVLIILIAKILHLSRKIPVTGVITTRNKNKQAGGMGLARFTLYQPQPALIFLR